MISTHHIISTDLYNIGNRIREIDNSYFIAFNYKTKKFELHAKNKRGGSLCLVLPFNKLDNRTLDYARRTRVENAAKLLKEIELNNLKIQQQKAKALASKAIASAF